MSQEIDGINLSNEEILQILSDARDASEELREKLSAIRIKIVGAREPDIISAIINIFGKDYVTDNGDSYITYDMYCSILNMIRTIGQSKAQEIL